MNGAFLSMFIKTFVFEMFLFYVTYFQIFYPKECFNIEFFEYVNFIFRIFISLEYNIGICTKVETLL